jgi:hypothetical protein
MELREIGWEGVDWIRFAQFMIHWQAFVNAMMNLRAASMVGISLTSRVLDPEGLCSMELVNHIESQSLLWRWRCSSLSSLNNSELSHLHCSQLAEIECHQKDDTCIGGLAVQGKQDSICVT